MWEFSHQECAPLARAGAVDEADIEIWRILGEVDANVPAKPPNSQHKRCKEAWLARFSARLNDLDDGKRKIALENASPLGRRWMSIIPDYLPLHLTDFDISMALHY